MWGFPKIWVPPVLIHLCLFLFWILTTIIQYIGYPHLWKPPFSYGFSHGLPMDHPTSSQCIPMVSGTPATLSRVTQVGLLSLYTPEMMAPISEHESSTMGIYMHLYIYIHIIHRINIYIYIYNYIYYIQWWESEIWTHIQLKGSRSIKPTKIGCHQSVNERLSLEHLYNTLGMGLQFSIFRF